MLVGDIFMKFAWDRREHWMLLALAAAVVVVVASLALKRVSGTGAHRDREQAYGKLSMSFEANQGQSDSRVRFLSRGSGYGLFLTSGEAVLVLSKSTEPVGGKAEEFRQRTRNSNLESMAIRMRL